MKPVNLLPEGKRPRGSGSTGNAPKAVVGVLAVVLVMVLGYVVTANQVNSRETEIAEARAATDAAQARVAALAPYAELAALKQARTAAVTGLASGRFDWERLMRELAMVLPKGSWLLELTASSGSQDEAGGAPAEPGSDTAGSPSAKLKGCSPSQPDVATLLVRLRKLDGVVDVQLNESRLQDGGGGGATDSAASGGCGASDFAFEITVSFEAPAPVAPGSATERVPAALGGGR